MSLPKDFCVDSYKHNNPDLIDLDKTLATFHYLLMGHKEGRSYKKANNVVVSIVTYKNEDVLGECLLSIAEKTICKNTKIVVTDNAAESRIERLVQRFRTKIDIEYIRNEKNEFFSAPHNKIIKRFKSSDIVLLNDDTVIQSRNWVRLLQEAAYTSNEIAGCGGKALMPNGNLEEAGTLVFNDGSVKIIGRDDNPNKKEYQERRFLSYCSWSMFYLKRDAINKVGLLDENLKPLYYEDTDWQYRAHQQGLKILYEPKCVYVHRGRSTTRNKLNEYSEASKQKFLSKYRNHNLEAYNDASRLQT